MHICILYKKKKKKKILLENMFHLCPAVNVKNDREICTVHVLIAEQDVAKHFIAGGIRFRRHQIDLCGTM